ncbi:MAG: hypothetical protein IJW92_02470 [Clostridia bacterium]|nr:hypothetical protein [Clostridia bacterium]
MLYQTVQFQKAVPVWEKNKNREMNQMLLFEAHVAKKPKMLLRISGYTSYRVFVNGTLIHYGPARAAHGFYRVDEISIEAYLTEGENRVCVLSTGYCCRSFCWLRQPSFLCAELVAENTVFAYTGDNSWRAYACPEYLQKVARYSYQRTFCEVYDYLTNPLVPADSNGRKEVVLERGEDKKFIRREVSLPDLERETCEKIVDAGRVELRERESYYQARFLTLAGNEQDGYPESDFELHSLRLAEQVETFSEPVEDSHFPVALAANRYLMLKMAGNRTGLIELVLDCKRDTDLLMMFDEILSDDGTVNFLRVGSINVVMYRLRAGQSYRLLTAEPYTLQYLNLISLGGEVVVRSVGMRIVAFNKREIVRQLNPKKADAEIARIYDAAVETFCQNTFDIYMDCPSRERAGWLCDSFFTSRVEYLLSGKSTVEHSFLANFAMVDKFDDLPDGMLPMCYPADALRVEFIPNWAMWFLLELEEYYTRTDDRSLVDELKEKMYALLGYFRRFENRDGLLERLENWVFVEWSKCNDLVQDINYPTNMLYYRFKKVISALYGDATLELDAEQLRLKIREQSRIGEFFCENAVLEEDGIAALSGEITETCQYYAFFTGVATQDEDPVLWETMVRDFGPERKQNNRYPEIYFSNAFIGNYLRLELLSRAGLLEKLEENIRGYFDYMAKRTGTLWEFDSTRASCDHGFASHVLVWLDRLGYLEEKK